MEIGSPDVIDYGARRRRFPWIKVGIASCLLAVAVGIYLQRASLLYWWSQVQLRREVLLYDIPTGTILFSQQPADTKESLRRPYIPRRLRPVTPADRMAGRSFALQEVTRDPFTVFLHERRTPAGKRRVVLVEADSAAGWDGTRVTLSVQLLDAGSVLHPTFTALKVRPADGMKLLGEGRGLPGVFPSLAWVPYGSDFQLFAGRPDPVDPSAFLIDVRQNGKTLTIKGRIGDDESLTLSTSDGSALPVQVTPTTNPAVEAR